MSFHYSRLRHFIVSMLLVIASPAVPAVAGTLYATDFEEFPAGDGEWAGNEGWQSNDSGGSAQGIIQDPVDDLPLGRTGFLGFGTPTSVLTSVYRTVDHEPATTDASRVTFESLLGVQDSTNGRRDRFHISIYNVAGDFLAALTFDNVGGTILSDDGVSVQDTGVEFQRGDQILGVAALQVLEIDIDLGGNHWSASIDGVPVFDQALTETDHDRSLGTVATEWEIASGSTDRAGDNWLLVADWLVASIPDEPFAVRSVERRSSGEAMLTWQGHPGFDYRVEYSPDLRDWRADLANSEFLSNPDERILSFTDGSSAGEPDRFYRVIRTPTP